MCNCGGGSPETHKFELNCIITNPWRRKTREKRGHSLEARRRGDKNYEYEKNEERIAFISDIN